MIGPFLIILGIGLLYVSARGKSQDVLNILADPTGNTNVDPFQNFQQGVKDWMYNNVWSPLATSMSAANPLSNLGNALSGLGQWLQKPPLPGAGQSQQQSSNSNQNNALVHGYNIPLAGGGSMTVNSTSMQGAIQDVIAQGGTPA